MGPMERAYECQVDRPMSRGCDIGANHHDNDVVHGGHTVVMINNLVCATSKVLKWLNNGQWPCQLGASYLMIGLTLCFGIYVQ